MRIKGTRELQDFKRTKEILEYKEPSNYENTRNQGTLKIKRTTELRECKEHETVRIQCAKTSEYKEPRNYKTTRNQGTMRIQGTKEL